MRLLRIALISALVLSASHADAQTGTQRPRGCRGTTTNTSTVTGVHPLNGQQVAFPTYPVLETVQPGSPAERAGMKEGDRILMQDGRDVVGEEPARTPMAGDTVPFVIDRGGQKVQVTVVMGRWDPEQETPGVDRVCRPVSP